MRHDLLGHVVTNIALAAIQDRSAVTRMVMSPQPQLCQPHTGRPAAGALQQRIDNVVGRAFAVVWPLNRMTWLSRPDDTFADVPQPAAAPAQDSTPAATGTP